MASTIKEMLWELGDNYPTSDIEANKLLRLLKEDKKEKERLLDIVKKEVEQLETQGQELEKEYQDNHNSVVGKLSLYLTEEVDEESIKETATTRKYKLLSGEIVVSKSKMTIAKPASDDEIKLMELYPNFRKVETKLNWGELKKRLVIGDDNKVKDKETGIEVPLSTIESPESFSVKI